MIEKQDVLYYLEEDDKVVMVGDQTPVTYLQQHVFATESTFPILTERVKEDSSDHLLVQDDLKVSYSTIADINIVESKAGYNNTLGAYSVDADGNISNVRILSANVKSEIGATKTYDVAEGSEIRLFIIADGYDTNKSFRNMDTEGSFSFVYHAGRKDERPATIDDDYKDVKLVYDDGSKNGQKIKGNIFHTTDENDSAAINADGKVHTVSGLADENDPSTLRIGFEDLKNLGDADFNDVVVDISFGTIEVENSDALNDDIIGTIYDDVIFGAEGHDTINGGNGDDILYGGNGDDVLRGNRGNDILYGGIGNDLLDGSAGDDIAYGEDGNDTLLGGYGNDVLYGGLGNDFLRGGQDNDVLYGEDGDDTLYGDDGDDELYGGDGNDYLDVLSGTNILDGGAGDDIIRGGTGSDTIYGGSGNDDIYGGAGDDIITAGEGNNIIDGGDGDDIIYSGLGMNVINGGDGIDTVDYSAALQGVTIRINQGTDLDNDRINDDKLISIENAIGSNFDDVIIGHPTLGGTYHGLDGNDTMRGYDGIDIMYGGAGDDDIRTFGNDDIIYAGDGDDYVLGGLGNDFIDGGAGNDRLYGEDGDDIIYGGDGNDLLYGGDGNDILYAGAGFDKLFGGDGDDTLVSGEGRDIMNGGAGSDTFVFLNYNDNAYDIVYDFTSEDALDITDLLSGFDPVSDNISDFIILTDNGVNTFVQVDMDGAGTQQGPTNVVLLSGATGLDTVEDLVNNGTIIV